MYDVAVSWCGSDSTPALMPEKNGTDRQTDEQAPEHCFTLTAVDAASVGLTTVKVPQGN